MQSDITQFQAILNRVGAEKDEAIQSATKWAVDQSLLALRQQEEIDRLRAELAAEKAALAEARRMISEINDENERLSAELVSKADELAAAIKQRDEARLDAERYRWLKSEGCQWVTIYRHPSGDEFFDGKGDSRLDERIDAARVRDKQGGGA